MYISLNIFGAGWLINYGLCICLFVWAVGFLGGTIHRSSVGSTVPRRGDQGHSIQIQVRMMMGSEIE